MIQKMRVSVIIIARNEETRIRRCLESVAWADEKIVIDNNSSDNTSKIAKKLGAKVVPEESNSFSLIRDIGARHASGEWLLYVDADEMVTGPLRDEILEVIQKKDSPSAFFILRQNYYLGAAWPTRDGMVRLIKKSAFVRWDGILHEHAIVDGETGRLRNYFIHHTHRSLEEMVAKTNEWSKAEAQLRFSSHHPKITWWRLLRVMITAFFDSFILQSGWKAGVVGWIESMYQAFSIFITYAKLWEMQQKS